VVILGFGFFKPYFRKTFVFWLGLIHLFVLSLPMMITRLLTVGAEFSDVKIFGIIPGPAFHHLSEGFYLVLVVGTVVDRIRYRAMERQNKNGNL
jgi:hypothetical protein